ncbi:MULTISPECIES: TPM domain-containing protein [Methylomonas]|uniref:TPM domain-containing protein n=2 Tax=Methylomonas TaxID=416 RepID=A0A140E5Q8_9GAMM|nr:MULTISPECIES: YgcG family protein [Methylomonas]AMK78732.1 hypothetical protein JT25_019930 [Methylomonas denitrificans]OAH99009.1 hypothetical protein A1342_09470 [Methylomonas methanica]
MRKPAGFPGFVVAVMLAACLFTTLASAEQAVPSLEQRVTDMTATLSAQQRTALEQRLQAFEQQKGSQIAVLIVASTQPEDIAQYAIRVVEKWRLGRKGVDDGILLLLAKDDRTTRIEVGYGLEGVVPDVLAKRIIDDIMIPYFRQGDYAKGINAGVDSLIGLIQGEPLPAPAAPRAIDGPLNQYFPFLFLLAIAGGGILRAVLGRFLGGLVNGGLVGILVWLLGGGLLFALLLAFVAFLMTQSNGRGFRGGRGGGFGSGGFGGGGGFSGGGGGFGGGGASGRW